MVHLIDKDAIVAEIERRLEKISNTSAGNDRQFAATLGAQHYELISLVQFIDTLEVKDVDLCQEIKNRIDSLAYLYCYMEDLFNGNGEEGVYPIPEKVTNELFEFAKHFFELGLKTQKRE